MFTIMPRYERKKNRKTNQPSYLNRSFLSNVDILDHAMQQRDNKGEKIYVIVRQNYRRLLHWL